MADYPERQYPSGPLRRRRHYAACRIMPRGFAILLLLCRAADEMRGIIRSDQINALKPANLFCF